jgi:hypothetical protein
VTVGRDTIWNGRRFIGPEEFYLARFSGDRPSLSRLGLMADEQQNLREYAWLLPDEFGSLVGRLEPPTLAAVVDTLIR